MAKPATGELRKLANGWEARIRIDAKTRKGFELAVVGDEAAARARCTAMATIAARLRAAGHVTETEKLLEMAARAREGKPWNAIHAAVDALCAGMTEAIASGASVPTFAEMLRSWTSGELAKKYPHHVKMKRSAETDRQRAGKHIVPHIGDFAVNEITLDHAELVMASIPDVASAGTRRQVAQLIRKVLALAVYPCRYRADNPVPRNWLPRAKSTKAKECLYPDEDAKLLGCRDVPLLRRIAYGFLSREGMRREELAKLTWSDLDLARGKINLDENKTDDPRDWDLDPTVALALVAWKERYCSSAQAADRVFAEAGVPLNIEHLAETFRADLKRAGVTRSQLFERSASRQPIRVHDLRATFVTVSLANGKTETWVADRTGHRSSQQISAYRRKARTWSGMALGTLTPLYYALPDFQKAARVGSLPHGLPHETLAKVAELADALDSGSAMPSHEDRIPLENRDDGDSRSPEMARLGALPGQSTGHSTVDDALARALDAAAAAGRFDVVAQLAKELEARRLARSANVVDLASKRRQR